MPKRNFRMTVRSHHDACFLLNAIREHGEKTTTQYQNAFIKAKSEGRDEDAEKFLGYRIQTERVWRSSEKRLNAIRKHFENMFDEPSEDAGTGYGYSIDNATCHN